MTTSTSPFDLTPRSVHAGHVAPTVPALAAALGVPAPACGGCGRQATAPCPCQTGTIFFFEGRPAPRSPEPGWTCSCGKAGTLLGLALRVEGVRR